MTPCPTGMAASDLILRRPGVVIPYPVNPVFIPPTPQPGLKLPEAPEGLHEA